MKKLLACLFLGGCSFFQTTPFDGTEYNQLIALEMQVDAYAKQCLAVDADKNAAKLYATASHLERYVWYRKGDTKVHMAVVDLLTLVKDLNNKYKDGKYPSEEYCIQKYANVKSALDLITPVIGER